MNKSISYFLCWCLCTSLSAQTSKVDSLEQALNLFKGNSFEKGMLLLDISNEYRFADTAKCRMYIMEALNLAQKNGWEKIEAIAYRFLGNYYISAEQFFLSHANFKEAERLLVKQHDQEQLYIIYHNLMLLFNLIDDMDNVAYYADKIIEMASEHYDLTKLMSGEILSDTLKFAHVTYNVATLVYSAQLFKGMAHYMDEVDQEALDYFLDMFRKAKLLNIKNNYIQFVTEFCGRIYIQQNRPLEAMKYLNMTLYRDMDTKTMMNYSVCAYLAEAYAMLHRTDSAECYLKKTYEVPIMTNDLRLILYRCQSLIASNKGDYRSALESYKKYHQLTDSIAKVEKSTEISGMKNWYELEQKDKKNQILQQEGQKQHKLILILAGALVMIFVLLALSVYLYRKTVRKNRELKNLHTVKDKLFSVVAHDLRSPMSALMSMLRLASNDMIDAETQARLLKDISSRVDDTYGLLDNLLHWSKSQMQGIVPSSAYFDVQDGSRAVTDSLYHIAAAKTITLANRIEERQVYADRDMFAVVVRNLTMNAIKYTSAGGEITLDSELSGDMVVISVKDTGTGMSKEVQDQLFKLSETKSRRGTNNESGTGLGLILCADFVKINGGNIWLASKQGEGSTFFFSIPTIHHSSLI